MSRYIDADKIPYVISEDGCLDDFAYRYDINEVPAADVVEVRHGEWIFDFTLDGDDFYECSICGRQEVLNGLCKERNIAKHLPYCHCGAKMDGERREE